MKLVSKLKSASVCKETERKRKIGGTCEGQGIGHANC